MVGKRKHKGPTQKRILETPEEGGLVFKAAAVSRVAAFRMEFAGIAPVCSDASVCHHRTLDSHTFDGLREQACYRRALGVDQNQRISCLSLPVTAQVQVWRQPNVLAEESTTGEALLGAVGGTHYQESLLPWSEWRCACPSWPAACSAQLLICVSV